MTHALKFRIALLVTGVFASAAAPAQEHTLNLQNADIRTLVTTVADITGKNFVVDPRVSGEVTVVSSEPMGAEEIYQVFLSVLSVHGLAAVPSGQVIKIMPATGAQAGTVMPRAAAPDALVTRIVEPDHVSAARLEPLLRPLLPPEARLTVFAPANLLIVTDRAGNVERLAEIIERVDTATADAKVEVIRLQHASAAEVVRLINQLYPQAAGTGPMAVADQRTNTILLTGDPSMRLRVKTLIAHLDTPLEGGGATRVVYLNYADAEALVPILQSVSRALAGERAPAEGEAAATTETSIRAHAATNSLIISASPAVFDALENVIRKLDVRRAQVLVEAIIAEVAVDKARELGIQWQITDGFEDDTLIGGTNFGGPGTNILGLSVDPTQASPGLNLGYLAGTVTIPGTENTIFQLGALLRALQTDASSNVLSTPSLVTLDNAEAVIQVGKEVPFVTGRFLPTASGDEGINNPFQTIERDEVGIKLTVTPHINQGDTVRLDIEQEVSSIAPASLQGAVDLITNKRTLKTSVLVHDGEILVLGGLIDEQVEETQQSVPLLGDIPLLGNLFRYRTSSTVKRNLMVFVQPHILRTADEASLITGGKYQYIRQQQIQARRDEENMTPPENMPLLPEIYEYLGPPDKTPALDEP